MRSTPGNPGRVKDMDHRSAGAQSNAEWEAHEAEEERKRHIQYSGWFRGACMLALSGREIFSPPMQTASYRLFYAWTISSTCLGSTGLSSLASGRRRWRGGKREDEGEEGVLNALHSPGYQTPLGRWLIFKCESKATHISRCLAVETWPRTAWAKGEVRRTPWTTPVLVCPRTPSASMVLRSDCQFNEY